MANEIPKFPGTDKGPFGATSDKPKPASRTSKPVPFKKVMPPINKPYSDVLSGLGGPTKRHIPDGHGKLPVKNSNDSGSGQK